MTFATLTTWILIAVAVACGAGAVTKHGGRGRTADVLLALSASGAAYLTAWAVGILPEPGLVTTAVVAGAAASAAIAVQRKFF